MKQDTGTILGLVRETRISGLLNGSGRKRCEASGVFLKDGQLHIVFDDTPHLLRISPDWGNPGEEPVVLGLEGTGAGYEDITYQASAGRWLCLVEAAETEPGMYMPRVDTFDESFAFTGSYRLGFPFKAGNKGFEGMSVLRCGDSEYLLGLCEGNKCKSGSAGARKGKGRIQVFRWAAGTWEHAGTIRLPGSVRFSDYASLDIRNGRMTVISQKSSAMWVGRLRTEPAGFEDLFMDEGRSYLFPRDDKGRILYGNVEGVAWLADDRVAVVSDKAKDDQPGRCAKKDQSVHIFSLPAEGPPGDETRD